jgi:hypothetical protein
MPIKGLTRDRKIDGNWAWRSRAGDNHMTIRLLSNAFVAAVFATALTAAAANASTYTVFESEQGWITSTGSNGTSATNNFVVGKVANDEFRNFFGFSIPTLDGPIVSASLVVFTHDVTSTGGLVNYFLTQPVFMTFSGLAFGTVYGNALISTAMSNLPLTIDLNSDALSAIGNGGFLFVIGGRDTNGGAEFAFGTSDGDSNTHLVITTANATTPLPAALPLFASGLGALSLLGWRRKRKTI